MCRCPVHDVCCTSRKPPSPGWFKLCQLSHQWSNHILAQSLEILGYPRLKLKPPRNSIESTDLIPVGRPRAFKFLSSRVIFSMVAGHVEVLDQFYLAITLLITIAYQLFFFAIAWTFKFDKVTDFAGGTNFFLLALITLLFGGVNRVNDARNIVVSILVMTWALRLSGFLLFRILKSGSDTRFDDKRNNFFKFLGFWIFQMIW